MPHHPEFALAVACCRWPPSPQGDEAVRAAAQAVDWDLFLKVIRRHRVEGLAEHAFRRTNIAVPPEVAAALSQHAGQIVRQNLHFAAESRRLTEAMEAAGIAHLFVKGLTLNILAYGSLGLKRSCDIDLLVDPERYRDACAVLADAGYRTTSPRDGSSAEAIARHAEATKDSVWHHPKRGVVELHQRLSANSMLLPGVTAHSRRQLVSVAPGVVLPTLAKEELFAYLCVHGALTAWSRLKWAADLAAFLRSGDGSETERLYRAAQTIAPGRSLDQALLLCHALFDLELSEELLRELRSDRVSRSLAATAQRVMVQGGPDKELDDQMFGTWRLNLSLLRLQRGWRFMSRQLAHKGRAAAFRMRE